MSCGCQRSLQGDLFKKMMAEGIFIRLGAIAFGVNAPLHRRSLSLESTVSTADFPGSMSQRKICYLDNNATTRVAPEVVEAMLPFLTERWGNPSSAYAFGKEVSRHVKEARAKVAALVNAEPKEIVFTSCGTESNNSAIHSALALQPGKKHVI